MNESSTNPRQSDEFEARRPYRAPALHYFGAVTDLTNSALGTCADDADTNNCGGPQQNMAMQ